MFNICLQVFVPVSKAVLRVLFETGHKFKIWYFNQTSLLMNPPTSHPPLSRKNYPVRQCVSCASLTSWNSGYVWLIRLFIVLTFVICGGYIILQRDSLRSLPMPLWNKRTLCGKTQILGGFLNDLKWDLFPIITSEVFCTLIKWD